ncbi:hypothetical protein GcC1_012045 [Golovinomyces cichoracearum]|uniref:Uncharacterized protein n=1 Tax=Golovinomyces cichoracearum TaxID=62708 RepID=A0A420J771_9PEZI|nr:hypothetical protein GcC1_012045 [Golovinomyces cichoracearum]
MPRYAPPLESGTESDSSPETISRISTNSFQSVIDQADISTEMSTQNNGLPSEGNARRNEGTRRAPKARDKHITTRFEELNVIDKGTIRR